MNLPSITERHYSEARSELISVMSLNKKVLAIYETGSVSQIGLSDLDFLLVISEDWNEADTSWFYNQLSNFSKTLRYLIGNGSILILTESHAPNVLMVDDFAIHHVYGQSLSGFETYCTDEFEILRVLDWLPERLVTLAKVASDVNNEDYFLLHGIIKSTFVSLRKVEKLTKKKSYSNRLSNMLERLRCIRSRAVSYFDNDKYKIELKDFVVDLIELAAFTLVFFEKFLRGKSYLCLKKQSGKDNAFLSLDVASNNSFVLAGKDINFFIPDVYFLNYYLQSCVKNTLGGRIKENLQLNYNWFEENHYVSSDLLLALNSRSFFVNGLMCSLKKKKFTSGLLKYGMYLKDEFG